MESWKARGTYKLSGKEWVGGNLRWQSGIDSARVEVEVEEKKRQSWLKFATVVIMLIVKQQTQTWFVSMPFPFFFQSKVGLPSLVQSQAAWQCYAWYCSGLIAQILVLCSWDSVPICGCDLTILTISHKCCLNGTLWHSSCDGGLTVMDGWPLKDASAILLIWLQTNSSSCCINKCTRCQVGWHKYRDRRY
jgi:hypothetical protein